MRLLKRYRNAYTHAGVQVADNDPNAYYDTLEEQKALEGASPSQIRDYWISQGATISEANGIAGFVDANNKPLTTITNTPLALKSNYTTLLIGLGIAGALILTVLLISKKQ